MCQPLSDKNKLLSLDSITGKPGGREVHKLKTAGAGKELLPGEWDHCILGTLVCEGGAGQAQCGQVGTTHQQGSNQLQERKTKNPASIPQQNVCNNH